MSIVQCNHCGLVFLDPQPSWEDLEAFYPRAYYPEEMNTRSLLSRMAKILGVGARGEALISGGNLLDVGCGNGDFLVEM